MLWVVAAMAYAVECNDIIPIEELKRSLDQAEQAFLDFDDTAFRDRVNVATGVYLPCVGDAVPPEVAAQYHTVLSLHFLTIGDEANAALSLQAARAVQPDAALDPTLFPDGHPGHAWWASYDPASAKSRRVPEPRVGSVAFDGTHTRERWSELPQLFQLFDETGRARSTSYLAPRQELPAYAAIPRKRNALIGCSSVGVVGSAALLAGAGATRAALVRDAQDLSVTADALDQQRASANALAVGSAGLLGVGVGCGAGAAWIGPR